uniref:Uncharacterized protein n=1 Tax=Rhizophora mucronata TaxID=61149 RepID=A0A2P2MHW2_RHIMU
MINYAENFSGSNFCFGQCTHARCRLSQRQSSNHYSKHGGYGQSSIGEMVSYKITSIPEKKSITTENNKVSCT